MILLVPLRTYCELNMTDQDDVLNDLGMMPSAENSGASTATFGNNSPDPTTTLAAALPTEALSSPEKSDIEFSSGNEWHQIPESQLPVGTGSTDKSWVEKIPEFPTNSTRWTRTSIVKSKSPRPSSGKSLSSSKYYTGSETGMGYPATKRTTELVKSKKEKGEYVSRTSLSLPKRSRERKIA